MEALDILKSMEKISPDLISDPSTQSQMKNFVNMLDDMAANNPDVKSIAGVLEIHKAKLRFWNGGDQKGLWQRESVREVRVLHKNIHKE